MEKEKRKKYSNYFWNGLFAIIVIVLIIPSWRIKFQSTIQSVFMRNASLNTTILKDLDFKEREWLITDLNNKESSFSDYKDQTIVLNFWATWCPSCRAELPELYDLSLKIDKNVKVICVTNESIETILENDDLKKYEDILFRSNNFPQKLDFKVYPTTFIFAPNFQLIEIIEGAKKFDSHENLELLNNLK